MKKKNSGFTIVELLAFIVILAILITIASVSVISVINKSREKMSQEIRGNLKETAISYVIGKYPLTKCSDTIINTIEKGNNVSDNSCLKKITINTLITEGMFEDNRKFCNGNDTIIVYRTSDDYKAYLTESTCKN